ncbi:uncharacterized protein GLRG_11996 [Colletotrichum graminicola M1.001]|uniref:Uncharacterized protein n=1 Tax=Colletotrichum graminicola (strain M1.001 / M2 / FGSC 10212) TaxID=645133 RepID=E3R162_COLGM|nr:uncharacterized protein GLRG_11996 [Colletotrichum graminicola M1.001]EFQ36850.1 hypothetical protein GLRG_11996 [Colletotrichum graminicola M1.001]
MKVPFILSLALIVAQVQATCYKCRWTWCMILLIQMLPVAQKVDEREMVTAILTSTVTGEVKSG